MPRFKRLLSDFWQLLKTTYTRWNEKDPFKESAVIAYYYIFSLPGLLVLVFTIASYFLSDEVENGALHQEISQSMGKDTADQVGEIMTRASLNPNPSGQRLLEL